jgi:glycosyltransferase involved in cell wall biosynthesis
MSRAELVKRILLVSSSYPADARDWRGIFIRHLVGALARRPELRLRIWAPPGERPANVDDATDARARAWLADLMRHGGISHLVRAGGVRALVAPVRLLWLLRRAYRNNRDVTLYHVNWLQNALPLPRDGRPLLVSVLGNDLQLLKLPLMRTLLRRVFRGRPVVLCPNADWMVPALREAFGDLARVECVPFGIDAAWYALERQRPSGPARWLCVTRLTRAKLGELFAWGTSAFRDPARELHLFGPMQERIDLPSWVHYHGATSAPALLDTWFPQATGLITLSRHAEGRPQVMLEAMAAGLPIVATRMPAHDDLLADERGLLCDSAPELAQLLARVERPEDNQAIGANARAWVRREVGDWNDCAARYAALYDALLAQGNG